MPSTRRRFLAGTLASVTAGIAGCSDSTTDGPAETVTPVGVPRTEEEFLQEAADIDSPSIPAGVIVTDNHHAAAIEDAESTVADAEAMLAESNVEPDDDGMRPVEMTEPRLERAADHIETAREAGPSVEALTAAQRATREAGRVLGIVGAVTGHITDEQLEEEIERQREVRRALEAEIEYRVAEPLAAHLPTYGEAELALEDLRTLLESEASELADIETDSDAFVHVAGRVRGRIAVHHRQLEDAERFLNVATDSGAQSIRTALDRELRNLQDTLERIAAEHDIEDSGGPRRETVRDRLEATRLQVGQRSNSFLSDFDEYRTDGRRLRGVLETAEYLTEFAAVKQGSDRTIAVLEGGEVPAEEVLVVKRGTVERIENATGGTALQRYLASGSTQPVASADRTTERSHGDSDATAQAYFFYASAGAWAADAMTRGEQLSESLLTEQS